MLIGIMLVIIIVLIAFFSKMKIEIRQENKNTQIQLIIFKVIKIKPKVKTNKDKKKGLKYLIEKRENIKSLPIRKVLHENMPSIEYLLSKMVVDLRVDCNFYIGSPDKTAIIYGSINTLIYSFENILKMKLKKYEGKYNFNPDFKFNKNNISADIIIYIRNLYMIIFIVKMLPILLKYKKFLKEKGGEYNGSSNRRINENYNG